MFRLAFVSGLVATSAWAEDQQTRQKEQDASKPQVKQQEKVHEQTQDKIYGSKLMTNSERMDYRNKMRNAKNQDEREQLRLDHHKQMQERAKRRWSSYRSCVPVKQ